MQQYTSAEASYSITSSARASRVGGISIPSAFAVLRLKSRWRLQGRPASHPSGCDRRSRSLAETARGPHYAGGDRVRPGVHQCDRRLLAQKRTEANLDAAHARPTIADANEKLRY